MTEWSEVTQNVLNIAQELILDYHPDLMEARVAFVFRDKASKSGDKLILGKAAKISEKLKVHLDYDFLIWIAEDTWYQLSEEQRKALVDHELSHCTFKDGEPKLRHHDIEEFEAILDRYGLWNISLLKMAPTIKKSVQLLMDITPTDRGAVIAADISQIKHLERNKEG